VREWDARGARVGIGRGGVGRGGLGGGLDGGGGLVGRGGGVLGDDERALEPGLGLLSRFLLFLVAGLRREREREGGF